jgi:superfamily II DNA or RNA helicase
MDIDKDTINRIKTFISNYQKDGIDCKDKFKYMIRDNVIANTIHNHGLKSGQQACRGTSSGTGMYDGFTIEAIDDIPYVITDKIIHDALKLLLKSKTKSLINIARTLDISDLYLEHTVDGYSDQLVFYTIDFWLSKNKMDTMFEDYYNISTLNDATLDIIKRRTKSLRSDPVKGRFKIVATGAGKNNEPVVPLEWIGRVFKNGVELHAEMDKLPNRKGQPPVMYCCINNMRILETITWSTSKISIDNNLYLVTMNTKENGIYVMNNYTKNMVNRVAKKVQYKYIKCDNLTIGVDVRIFHEDCTRLKVAEPVGYLSSLLQKSMRRGDVKSLEYVCDTLNKSKPYNLPDHNFALVSGTRQLLWRSFISLVEDAQVYYVKPTNDDKIECISVCALVILSLVAHTDPIFRVSPSALNIIINTVSTCSKSSKCYRWSKHKHFNIKTHIDKDIKGEHIDNVSELRTDVIPYTLLLNRDRIPMMKNDRDMLSKTITCILSNKPIMYDTINNTSLLKITNFVPHTRYAALDMHCYPTMLLVMQSMLNQKMKRIDSSPSLQEIGGFIWDNFSGQNYRKHKYGKIAPLRGNEKLSVQLYNIVKRFQKAYVKGKYMKKSKTFRSSTIGWLCPYDHNTHDISPVTSNDIPERVIRVAWLILFGMSRRHKYKGKVYHIMLTCLENISDNITKSMYDMFKVKTHQNKKTSMYVSDKNKIAVIDDYIKTATITSKPRTLPDGYVWKVPNKSFTLKWSNKKFVLNDNILETVDELCEYIEITSAVIPFRIYHAPYEMLCLVRASMYMYNYTYDKTYPNDIERSLDVFPDINHENIVVNDKYVYEKNIMYRLRDIIGARREFDDYRVFDWLAFIKWTPRRQKLMRLLLSKLETSDYELSGNNTFTIQVGPCDRSGKKTSNSILYRYEGVILRLLTLMECLYPRVLTSKTSYNYEIPLRWSVTRNREYKHMIDSIRTIIGVTKKDDSIKRVKSNVKISTTLWEHQTKSVNRFYSGVLRGVKGFGDASKVGSGKTLISLALMSKLHNTFMKSNTNHKAFLVLVPNIPLISTWITEVNKHTKGFDTILQQSNGTLKRGDEKITESDIKFNSLVISTMGRIRDHPINIPWILMVIDECLSVQNSSSLQTGEAWRQSIASKSVLMLSATFFRSRFDKMLYMLKMLKSDLPETLEYLDTILSEHIIANVSESNRVWKATNSKHVLSKKLRNEYEKIYNSNQSKGSEKLYIELCNFIEKKVDYIDIFYGAITKSKHRNVIFTKSKREADAIYNDKRNINSKGKKLIGRYPEKLTHVVLSYSEGAYGVNDLVEYNGMIMRPPMPDMLPQIKGRLDRPGQKNKDLYIEYVLVKDTIEEAGLIRLDACNRFYGNYLMPLAEFYEIACKVNDNLIIKSNTR